MNSAERRNDLSNLISRWFAFYVFPHCEKNVYADLIHLGFDAYLPVRKEIHQWSDRKKSIETPLFTSYVFAKIFREDYYSKIKFIEKIVKIVDIGGEIISIPEGEMNGLKKICESNYTIASEPIGDLQAGDQVRLNSGPLKGLEGKVVLHSGKSKFAFELNLMKRMLILEIDRNDIVKI